MEDNVALYEQVMVNTGKSRGEVWNELAFHILQESYMKDKEIYGAETRELYGILFENTTLFESIDERDFQLNEDNAPSEQYLKKASEWVAKKKIMGNKEEAMSALDAGGSYAKLTGFGTFAKKIKDLFATFGGSIKKYFANGIAGVVANPFPLVAAGAGVGLVIALIRKFKKMSDEKKSKAMAKLSSENKKKIDTVLAKPEDVLKKELEAKAKPAAVA